MIAMAGLSAYVLYFLLLVGPLVLFHELGHFAVAKWCGVKVVRFSFGFGPKLLAFRRGETEYCLSLLPLGGYVKMAGDNPAEPLAPEDHGRGFLEAAPWKRILIALAGPVNNLILPVLVFFVMALSTAQQGIAPFVGAVMPGSPADAAGLAAGDTVTAIDGKPIRVFDDIREAIGDKAGVPLTVTLRRGAAALTVRLTPRPFEEKDDLETTHRAIIGIRAVPPPATIGVMGPDTPAAKAGLRTFDRIAAVNGEPVEDGLALQALLARPAKDGAPATLTVLRGVPLGYPGLGPGLPRAFQARLVLGPGAGIELDDRYVRWVIPGSPAAAAGIRAGDRLVALDGRAVQSWWGFDAAMEKIGRRPIALTVQTPGQPPRIVPLAAKTLDLGESPVTGGRIEALGVGLLHDGEPLVPSDRVLPRDWVFPAPRLVARPSSLASIARDSIATTAEITRKEILGILRMFQGRISVKNLGGPLMIADVARQAAEQGFAAFLFMMTLVSINLGLLNLFPMPVLDGGHVVTALVEAVRRKPLSMKARERTQAFGFVLLVALMAFAIVNDFVQKRGPSWYP